MKNRFFTLLFLFLLLGSCTGNHKDWKVNLSAGLQKHQNIHYKVQQKYFYSNQSDTTQTDFEVWAIRGQKNDNQESYVWVDDFYRPYHMIFEKNKFYLSIPPKKTTLLYKNFSEDMIAPVDWIDVFLHPADFIKQLNDKNNKVRISDTLLQSKKARKLDIVFPKNAKGEQHIHTYVLDENWFPIQARLQIKSKEHVYINELSFSDCICDQVNYKSLKTRQAKILAENPIEEASEAEAARLEGMLHVGDQAPLFDGKIYASEKIFHLADYIGKNVIVVDFWYTHCPPCVKAIPELIELQKNYAEKGLKVFGLNSVDNQPRSMKYLKSFLSKRSLGYDVILTQPEVDMVYKIKGYPSLYVVDKHGKIAYVELGYDKKKFKHLKEKVKKLLE